MFREIVKSTGFLISKKKKKNYATNVAQVLTHLANTMYRERCVRRDGSAQDLSQGSDVSSTPECIHLNTDKKSDLVVCGCSTPVNKTSKLCGKLRASP